MSGEVVLRVTAPHFTATLALGDNRCTAAPPHLAWCVGRHVEHLRATFARHGWSAIMVRA